MEKVCIKCGEEKPATNGYFHIRREAKDGLRADCKKCHNIHRKNYRKENKEKISIKDKERWPARYKKDKQKYLIRSKEYEKMNKEKRKEQKRIYLIENREKVYRVRNEYRNKKMKNDLSFKLENRIRCRIYDALKNNWKSASTMELLDCSIEHLKQHLESQFQEGMSWDNYGYYGWHVDHRRPCASFDLIDPDQQRECFHYMNLQPLWAEDNLSKGSKIQ